MKKRTEEEKKLLINRLNRIEGQIRGIKNMIDTDTYCIDVLTQISAARSALNSLYKLILTNHLDSCVVNGIKEGDLSKIDEIEVLLDKILK